MWRVKHTQDHKNEITNPPQYYLVSKAMKYRVSKTTYSVEQKPWYYYHYGSNEDYYSHDPVPNYNIAYYYIQNQTHTPPVILDTEASQGVSEWYLYRTHRDNGQDVGRTDWYKDEVYGRSHNGVFNSALDVGHLTSLGVPGDHGVDKSRSFTGATTTEIPGSRMIDPHNNNRTDIIDRERAVFYTGDKYFCETFYEDITPYVISADDFKRNPNFYRPYFEGRDIRVTPGNRSMEYNDLVVYPEEVLHREAAGTTTKDEGFQGEYDASISVSYQRFNGEKITRNFPVKVQKRMCEAYSKGRWKLVGNKYVMQY
jgi:hypothetical protein